MSNPEEPSAPAPAPVTPASETLLRGSIRDAQHLLRYASAKGLDLDQDVIKIVVGAQDLLSQDPLDPATYDVQDKFWANYAKLTKLVQPATVESLQNEIPGQPSLLAVWWARIRGRPAPNTGPSASERAVLAASMIAISGLMAVMACQSFFEVGNSTLIAFQKAETIVTQKDLVVGEVNEILESAQAAGKSEADVKALKKTSDDANLVRATAISSIDRRLQLVQTVMFWIDWDRMLAKIEDDFDKAQAIVAQLEGILLLLREAVLPVLWGLVGATLYVNRALADDIRTTSYGFHRKIVFRSRYTMGMVAGFVVAKFFPVSVGVQNETVAPFALALVAGYSVEVLFSLLEKIINTFTSSK